MRDGWARFRAAGGRACAAADRAGGGLWVDLALYGLSALFAAATAASSLAAHRAWGSVAAVGYGAAAVVSAGQLALRSYSYRAAPDAETDPRFDRDSRYNRDPRYDRDPRHDGSDWDSEWDRDLGGDLLPAGPSRAGSVAARTMLTVATWCATALLPLVLQAVQRSQGRPGRAQEEVLVIEEGGRRLLETGTPYLDRAAIEALPATGRLLGYLPYQPGMAVFGLPRALDPDAGWWSDARVWFALAFAATVGAALIILRRAGLSSTALVRALQVVTVLPVCALTLATGGDDLPVLALCLLALALAATGRPTAAGVAVGAAAALKLVAWPVLVILGVHALTQRRLGRYAIGALGIPALTALPALLRHRGAMAENVLAFPLGRGLVGSPAASPLPGHLLAVAVPGGQLLALALLAATAVLVAVRLVRRPTRTAADAAQLIGWTLLAAILFLPASRFGYLLYPVTFLVWAPALRPRRPPAPRAATATAVAAP